jgi:hypothetical protein
MVNNDATRDRKRRTEGREEDRRGRKVMKIRGNDEGIGPRGMDIGKSSASVAKFYFL